MLGSDPARGLTPAVFGLGREGDQVAQRREPGECLSLELADALTREIELVADRFERPGLALEAETKLQDAPLPLGEGVQSTTDALAPQRLFGLVKRIGCLPVGEEVAELTLVVRADCLVQRDRGLRGTERLVDVLDRQSGRLGELVLRGLAAELDLEPARRARQLLLALDDVDGDADRAGVIGDRALD